MGHELTQVGKTYNAEYSRVEPDVLIVFPEPGFKDNEQSARTNMLWQQGFARDLGRKCGLVVMVNNLISQDAESRRVYSEGLLPELFYGLALVVGNPLARAIGSFFVGLSRPAVPVSLVGSMEEGISWLESVREA
ncbi:MAG TPA: hypothetical protein VLL49_08610 [Anaerolineales bacterium]|nr:hypothetical protein [Anaerolineales bacterium]